MNRKEEQEYFKTALNLIDFMRGYGHVVDERKSYERSTILRGPDANIVGVTIDEKDGHWIYYSFEDLADNGSIFDFVMNRTTGGDFSKACHLIRRWSRGEPTPHYRAVEPLGRKPKPMRRVDIEAMSQAVEAMPAITGHPYLEQRGIAWTDSLGALLAGKIRQDDRQNLIFPHRNLLGICGYEIKSASYRGFSTGGIKCLWRSNKPQNPAAIVVGEAVLDVISYHILNPAPATYLIGTSGSWGPDSQKCLQAAVRRLPPDGTVILAFDNDRKGHQYTGQVERLCEEENREAKVAQPPESGYDWNQVLMERQGLTR
ncbi:MAG: DUF3991 and TOPRIM domain-containing protein [Sumerlaeia bacterium]